MQSEPEGNKHWYNSNCSFIQAIENAGLKSPDYIIPDGKIHRFDTSASSGSKSGWYVCHGDWGTFGDWKTDTKGYWSDKSGGSYERHQPVADVKIDLKSITASAVVRDRVKKLWDKSLPTTSHPYLELKGIPAYGARVHENTLLIPVYNHLGQLQSLQQIYQEGEKFQKRFFKGSKLKGGFYVIGRTTPECKIFICEGYATGASIYSATNVTTVVAFNSGNLESVAKQINAMYPSSKIVLAADDDWKNPIKNIGVEKAVQAAQSINATYCIPVFG